jgi:hypothetical protein
MMTENLLEKNGLKDSRKTSMLRIMLKPIAIVSFILSLQFIVIITGCHNSQGVVKKEPDSKLAVPKKSDSKASARNKPNSEVFVRQSPAYEKDRSESPPWAPSFKDRTKYLYYYYPDFFVYFDAVRGVYFVNRDDKWQVELRLSRKIDSSAEYVILEMSTDMPYQFHSDVVKWFPPGYSKNPPKKK